MEQRIYYDKLGSGVFSKLWKLAQYTILTALNHVIC